jgi:DNA-binding transcriptional LysR family regulator
MSLEMDPMSRRDLPDLRALRAFLAVTETGSMTAAAHQLGITQSAVSQVIRQLETDMGVPLIVRDRRPFKLTAGATLLRQQASKLIKEAESLPSLLREVGTENMPEIRIGLVDSFAATIGPRLVHELIGMAVRLSVWSGLSPAHGEALLSRNLDVIVTTDEIGDAEGLERHLLLREPFILLLPRELSRELGSLRLDQLAAKHPIVRYSARSHLGTQIDRHLRRLNIKSPRRLEVDSSETLVAVVANGLGWAITTPLCLLQGRAHAQEVQACPLPGPAFNRHLWLVTRVGEYVDLPRRIASMACELLQKETVPDMRNLALWLAEAVVVGS